MIRFKRLYTPNQIKVKKVKGRDIYIPSYLQGNPDQQRFTIEVAY